VPRHIECCDISHLGGGDTVGAIVAMIDGQPASRKYKWFHVRGVAEGDDYAAMYQVLARRFRRGRAALNAAASTYADVENAPKRDEEWDLPDLFVVDGGKGQLSVAMAASRDLGLHQLPIVALAKEKDYESGPVVDRVYLPNQKNAIELREHSASMFFLARARDEAHRFANKAREKASTKRRLRSGVEDIRGIGPILKKELLRTLGSLKAIEEATDEQLLAVPGFTKRHLTALRKMISPPGKAGGTDST
jgi:excinuclease ABC subunit C